MGAAVVSAVLAPPLVGWPGAIAPSIWRVRVRVTVTVTVRVGVRPNPNPSSNPNPNLERDALEVDDDLARGVAQAVLLERGEQRGLVGVVEALALVRVRVRVRVRIRLSSP